MNKAEGGMLKKGDKVTYCPEYGDEERGIVKSLCDDPEYVFVVYHCAGEWENYENYTAARTHTKDLRKGWKDE